MRFPAALSAIALSGAVGLGIVGASASTPKPEIQPVSVPGYALAAEGTGWASGARVTFTLVLGSRTYGLELRTTRVGTFEVGSKHVDFCHGSRYWARDFRGHTAAGPIGDPYCDPNAYTSGLVVLKGKLLHPKVTRVYGTGNGKTIVIRLADAVYLSEDGTKYPKYVPKAPHAFFSLVGHGWLPVACATRGPGCSPQFYWQWIGMKTGLTQITLTPTCRSEPCPQYRVSLPVRVAPRP